MVHSHPSRRSGEDRITALLLQLKPSPAKPRAYFLLEGRKLFIKYMISDILHSVRILLRNYFSYNCKEQSFQVSQIFCKLVESNLHVDKHLNINFKS